MHLSFPSQDPDSVDLQVGRTQLRLPLNEEGRLGRHLLMRGGSDEATQSELLQRLVRNVLAACPPMDEPCLDLLRAHPWLAARGVRREEEHARRDELLGVVHRLGLLPYLIGAPEERERLQRWLLAEADVQVPELPARRGVGARPKHQLADVAAAVLGVAELVAVGSAPGGGEPGYRVVQANLNGIEFCFVGRTERDARCLQEAIVRRARWLGTHSLYARPTPPGCAVSKVNVARGAVEIDASVRPLSGAERSRWRRVARACAVFLDINNCGGSAGALLDDLIPRALLPLPWMAIRRGLPVSPAGRARDYRIWDEGSEEPVSIAAAPGAELLDVAAAVALAPDRIYRWERLHPDYPGRVIAAGWFESAPATARGDERWLRECCVALRDAPTPLAWEELHHLLERSLLPVWGNFPDRRRDLYLRFLERVRRVADLPPNPDSPRGSP